MNKKNILILPGDEIGPEITTEALKIIDYFNESKLTTFHCPPFRLYDHVVFPSQHFSTPNTSIK